MAVDNNSQSSLVPWIIGGLGVVAAGMYYLDVTSEPPPRRRKAKPLPMPAATRRKPKPKTKRRTVPSRPPTVPPARRGKAKPPPVPEAAKKPRTLTASRDAKPEAGYTAKSKGDWRIRWYNADSELIHQRGIYKKPLGEASETAQTQGPAQAAWWNVKDIKTGDIAARGQYISVRNSGRF